MKYVVFKDSTFSLYDSDFNANIPVDAVEVSQEVYMKMCTDQTGQWTVVDNKVVMIPSVIPPIFPRFYGNQKLDLFTLTEQLAIVTATMTDPVVKLIYDRLLGAAYWSYEDPETEQGLSLLQERGLITDERKSEVVGNMQPKQ